MKHFILRREPKDVMFKKGHLENWFPEIYFTVLSHPGTCSSLEAPEGLPSTRDGKDIDVIHVVLVSWHAECKHYGVRETSIQISEEALGGQSKGL